MRILVVILILCNYQVSALETDNYLTWRLELSDSAQKINNYLTEQIQLGLKLSNNKIFDQTCQEVTLEIAKRFKASFVHNNPIEKWMLKNLDQDEYFPNSIDYIPSSIYSEPLYPHLKYFGLAPNVMINNIYLGMDKLTHFSSTGRHYYNIYNKLKRYGDTDESAFKGAILYGLIDEATLHGFLASGVFSYADLEANFQGLLFFRRFCGEKENNYLKKVGDKWELIQYPDIVDYVNPAWDETFNPSYYLPENWIKISPILQKNYCHLKKSERVIHRFEDYRSKWKQSFSFRYIESLKNLDKRHTPKDQNQLLEKICSKKL